MFTPVPYQSPQDIKRYSSNSYTFQHIYKQCIQIYYQNCFKINLQKQNELILKDYEEKKTNNDDVDINMFIQEEVLFVS
jgi:hypothetical protein